MRVLVFNCGSSSLKFELIEVDSAGQRGTILVRGVVENMGTRANYTYRRGGAVVARGEETQHTHQAATQHALAWMQSEAGSLDRLDAVAHRIVHGGSSITQPTLIDERVIAAIEQASIFAPLHNPPALATIHAVSDALRGVPAVVFADTAFHRSLPPHAFTYAIPAELAERHGIRRYGFHGIGHSQMMERYAELSAKPVAELDLITLQLGAGCSISAIAKGCSVDTSMGLTPLEGLVMVTRSGDLDPAIISFLGAREKLSADEVERLLNTKSGLLGVSGISSDLREIEAAAARGDQRAILALDVFCYRVRKYIGAYMAVLGRADAIIFGGGIGEHSDLVRKRICAGLGVFDVILDEARNHAANAGESRVSAANSKIEVWVIPLDEELQMARGAVSLLKTTRGG
jgi:acetate kinase